MTANPANTSSRFVAAIGSLVLLAGLGTTGWAQNGHDETHDDVRHVPLFPAADNDAMRQGFVRIFNHEDASGEITIHAIDDSGHAPEHVTLTIKANATAHFNSDDLQNGNQEKDLSGGVGMPMDGDWRLEISSELDIEVLAFIRHQDGFLTSMHDIVPSGHGRRYRVAMFNPGKNTNQASHLRLINAGEEEAEVEIVGTDDTGESPGDTVELTVGAGEARTLSAKELEENADDDFVGMIGVGEGKWQLTITASEPIMVMSLLESTLTNQLTNLSTAPATEFESAFHVFEHDISGPIVQAKCVACHVEGGASAHTPLVFVRADVEGHLEMNFDQFKDYLAQDDDHGHDHDDDAPRDVVLGKIQGNLSHGGGEQVPADSDEFRDMERFLAILEDEVAAAADDHGSAHAHDDG